MTSDPFSAYYQLPVQQTKHEQDDPFAPYYQKPSISQNEPLLKNIGRQALRTGSRLAETVLGAPREGAEFLESLIPENALIKGAEKIGLGEGAKNLLETSKKIAPYKLLPKTEQVRDVTEFLFGKAVKPKNEWEEKADTLITDFASLALPIGGNKLKFIKPALLALGGNLASEGIGHLGGSEKEKAFGKLGTFVLGSMINPKAAQKLNTDLYAQAKANRPADATVNAKNLKNKITNFRKELLKGGTSESKSKTLKKLDELENSIKNGKIEVEELEGFKKSINEARQGLFDEFQTNKVGRNAAKRNLNEASKIVDNTLTEYGKTNPAWEKPYREANEVFGAISQSRFVRDKITKALKSMKGHLAWPAIGLFGIGAHSPVPTLKALGTAGVSGAAAITAGELIAKVMKSPKLRELYFKLIKNAAKENLLSTRKTLEKLNKDLEKEINID